MNASVALVAESTANFYWRGQCPLAVTIVTLVLADAGRFWQLQVAMILRRLGIPPNQRASTECVACNNCPDLFELEGGDFAVIGFDVTAEVSPHLPADAGCGTGERIVRIPREVLVAARNVIPASC